VERKNRLLPHREQKPRCAGGDDANHCSRASGSSIVTCDASAPTQVTNAAPCARWHIVQWQCATHFDGSVIENDTAPHKHLPVAFTVLPLPCLP
jgi:hypothetical protein